MADTNMQQCPSAFMDHIRETLFHQRSFRQSTDGIGQRSLTDSLQGVAHAQSQLLHVEWLGNVIISANFKPLQSVDPFTLFSQENNGNLVGTPISTYAAGNLIPINIWQADIKDHEIRQDSLGCAYPIFAPIDRKYIVTLNAKIGVQHFGYVEIIFHNQDLGFGVCHVDSTC